MIPYEDDFIKSVMGFCKPLDKKWLEGIMDEPDPKMTILILKGHIQDLQFAVRSLYIAMESEMRATNAITEQILKLPNNKEFEGLKKEVESQKNNTLETLLPIKKLAQQLEESKNKKVDYIG